jgi:hypothetical protein
MYAQADMKAEKQLRFVCPFWKRAGIFENLARFLFTESLPM